MSVSVASCSVSQLFSQKPLTCSSGKMITGQLAIPEYQRPYCWTETQIKQLLRDFQLHNQGLERTSVTQPCAFYLGSIILHQQDGVLNIIDGQQRLTTLALIAYVTEKFRNLPLSYESPESQQQIKHNLGWLFENSATFENLELSDVSISLVVTDSEDEAYNFFETQNTGGVRLKGPDIIKAHHLRAIDEFDKSAVNRNAVLWESLGNLASVVGLLLRGRYWQKLSFRDYPLHNQENRIRDSIVYELAETTGKGKDIAFGRITRTISDCGGESLMQPQVGYELRQPLNAGTNVIHYLRYFEQLRRRYLLIDEDLSESELNEYQHFYRELICKVDGCAYLKSLFDACLLLYVSQFGEKELAIAAKKLFRVVYSRRVKNQVAVKEKSVPRFVQETPVLDWIAMSYTSTELFQKLNGFDLEVEPSGLSADDNGVKKRFATAVSDYFGLDVGESEFVCDFGPKLSNHLNCLGEVHA